MFGGPPLRHERGATRPLAAHAEAEQRATYQEGREGRGKPARGGEDRIQRDAEHHRPRPAKPIGDPADAYASCGCRDEHGRSEQASLRLRQPEIGADGGQHQREQHDVEGVQHPAKAAGHQRSLCPRVRLSPPAEQRPAVASGCRSGARFVNHAVMERAVGRCPRSSDPRSIAAPGRRRQGYRHARRWCRCEARAAARAPSGPCRPAPSGSPA